jgi:exosome complex RNA-binding protein Rrp42 (RNase PH superfamily)
MNQKTIFVLVAIIATVGILIAASTIATPSALALKLVGEKDTKNNRNSVERTSSQESVGLPLLYTYKNQEHGNKRHEYCTPLS